MGLRKSFLPLLLVAGVLTVSSCQRYKAREEVVNPSDTYFSIKQYAADQVKFLGGVPHSLYKITTLNGNVDTTVVNFMNMEWSSIFKVFFESDISPKKFIGSYDFNVYEDGTTGSRGFVYTAKKPGLLTRTLQLNTDPSNDRITSIYIETAKKDFWGSKTQKLLYVPMKVIQIQEVQHHLVGKSQRLRIDYRFMEPEELEEL